jgi:3-oxoadipate enol-lactonase
VVDVNPVTTDLVHDLAGDRGPVIVFVNNLFSSRRAWPRLVPEAVRGHRVITYDLRNQGDSADATNGFSLQTHVDDLARLLDTCAVEQAWLVGTSLSSLICWDFGSQHPRRTAGMILCSPVFGPFGGWRRNYFIRSWLYTLDSGGLAGLFAQLYPLVLSDRTVQCNGVIGFLALRETFIGLHSSSARLSRSLAVFKDIDERPDGLQEIDCPVLLMAGDGDFLASAATVDMTSRLFRNGEQLILPGAGHLPYIDMPSRFQHTLLDFIDSRGRG